MLSNDLITSRKMRMVVASAINTLLARTDSKIVQIGNGHHIGHLDSGSQIGKYNTIATIPSLLDLLGELHSQFYGMIN